MGHLDHLDSIEPATWCDGKIMDQGQVFYVHIVPSICIQCNTFQVWGQAYGDSGNTNSTMHVMNSFLSPEHEIPLDHTYSPLHMSASQLYPSPTARAMASNWPRAQDHPFFYIGIYAAISLGAPFVSITGVITQYTGALRASRILFRRLLVGVVRATMRWHDVTPQGKVIDLGEAHLTY